MRFRDATNSARRGPFSSAANFFHCSVLPGEIGIAIARNAIVRLQSKKE
jgi:hypothetical protein